MIPRNVRAWARIHVRVLAYSGSTALISVWTVLRFFTQKTIFDLVGQQVLAGQLLHGGISGAGIGVTNYIPKMLFLYAPLHLLPGSPRIKLLLLTVLMNAATLILLGLVLERILRKFNVQASSLLWAGLLWIGAIAGSVFWVQFTNSRNLEMVGGVFLLYQGICYLERPSRERLLGISLFATILFFADTLQLYMTATPLILYGITLAIRSRTFRDIAWLGSGLLAGYLGSKLLFAGCAWLFSIYFIQNGGGAAEPSMHSLVQGGLDSFKMLIHLYSGAADAGKLRELCNLAFLITIFALGVYTIQRKLVPNRLVLLVGYILAINEIVYIASGQARQTDTERYLIMTAPALVLLLGGMQASWRTVQRAGLVIITLLVVCNGLFLTKALAVGSKHPFSKDAHLTSVASYVHNHPSTLPYASMDSALPISYLYGSDAAAPLSLSCSGAGLSKNNTFYSQTIYRQRERSAHSLVAIILDGNAITNMPSVCDQASVVRQLGEPTAIATTNDGSVVLLYKPEVSQKLHY